MGTGNMEFDNVQLDVEFSQASERDNITSNENIALSFGKLSTWFGALVPEGGSSGQILGWKSSGTAKWINSPTIPTVNDGIFSIKKGSTNIVTFSANQSSNTDLSFVEGSNVTITPNSTNRTVTIASVDEKVKVDKFVSTTQTDYLLTGAVASMATTAAHLVVDNADGVASARMRLQKGTTDTIGQSMLMLGNNIASGTSNNMQGMMLMYSSSDKYGKIVSESLTDNRTWTLPDKTGTIAMTSDIPTVNNGKLTIKGGTTSVAEFTANQSGNTDFSIVAGSNVTVTPDATNHKITIASSHPTYTRTDTTSTASPAHGETFTAIDSVTSTNGHVTAVNVKTVTLPAQYVHPGKTQTDTTSTASPAHGGTFTVVDSVTRDTSGHVSGINVKTVTLPSDQNTDTLMTQTNTTGSADYRVLLSGNANDTTETTTGRKSTNLRFNPSSGGLYSFGFLWTDITGQTLDINTLTLSDGTIHSRRFIQKTDGGADNITNIPVAGHPFLLEVDLIRWASTTDYITRQRFTNAANGTYSYVRYCTRGTWGNWTTRKYTDTNTKVTSAANHYTPATASGGDISESATGGTAAWGIDVVQGVTLNTDGKGHVTGISVASGKIPGNPNTDRYVNSAAFTDDSTNKAASPVKMTLTRAGSDSATIVGNIPKVSSSSAGVAPKGAAVSTQSQSTKFLREDGSWAAPTYTSIPSNNVTGSGTSGYLTKWNGTNTITNGPQLGSSTTTFLRNDGSWATPVGTTYSAGDHLSLSSNTFSVASYAKNLNGGDWNSVVANGWYMGSACTNAPSTAWWIGHVHAHNNKYCIQELWAFNDTPPDTENPDAMFMGHKMRWFRNSTWGPWVDVSTPTPSAKVNCDWHTVASRTTNVTRGWMAYWDGSYDGSSSNLAYCSKGAFGTIITKNAGDYVPNTQAGVNAAINLLSTGSSTPGLTDYYVSQYASGGTTTTTYHRRPISALWNAFKELITLTTTGSGNAVTAVSIANDGDHNRKITVTKGSTFSLSTHTHSNYLGAKSDGTYYGMASPTGADNVWIRTTSQGIIPYQEGSAGSGHNYLGTSSWYFAHAYIDTVHGSLDGTASQAIKLRSAAARTDSSVDTADTTPYQKYWVKIASCYTTGNWADLESLWAVNDVYGNRQGILKVRARVEGTAGTFGNTRTIRWIVADSDIDVNRFAIVCYNNRKPDGTEASGTATVELWWKSTAQYASFSFVLLDETRRTGKQPNDWVLYDTSTYGQAALPTTGNITYSTAATILNSTTGNATSANALNLTNGNELNFSKLASNGHVWFGYRWNTHGTETSGGTTITTYKFGNANGAGGLAGLEAGTIYENGTSLASKYAAIGHTHDSLYGVQSSSAVPVTTLVNGQLKVFYNVNNGLSGNMPATNNANAIIQINKHGGDYDSQLGFSSNGNIYYRSCNGTVLSSSVPWRRIYDTSNPPTASEVGALASTTKYAGSSSVGGAATSANKLNTNAGASNNPVYFSGGVPVACNVPASGSWFNGGIPEVRNGDGVMEIGKYIDFHATNASTADYDYRIETTTTAMTLTAGGASNILSIKSSDYAQLSFQTTSSGKAYTSSGIICYPLTASGMTALFSFGGNVVIGGGEAAKTLYDNDYDTIKTTEHETLYLASDSAELHLITDAQSYAGRKVLKILGGQLTKSGGSWIAARDNAPVHSYKGGDGTSGSFYPAIFSKSKNGGWAIGTLGNADTLYASYTKDTDYSSSTNTSTYTIQFPKESGTLALTADLDSYLPLSGGTMTGAIAYNNATTRLNSLKNLTNDNVGTSATYFLTITDSWGKGGYTKVSEAKTVLGIGATTSSGTAKHLAYYNGANSITDAGNIIYSVEDSTKSRSRTILHLVSTQTVGNDATQLVGGVKGVLSYGDGGPQINFSTSSTIGGGQDSSIIWTDNDGAGYGASWHFVSNQPDWNVVSKRFHARTAISIGTDVPPVISSATATNYPENLYVSGTSKFTYSDFGQIHIVRSGSTWAAGIKFSNSNGLLGAIGMTGNVDTPLIRWAHDLSTSYTIIDTSLLNVTETTNLGLDGGTNAFGYVSGLTKAAWNFQQTDGTIIRQYYNANWKTEIFMDYRTGQMSTRGKNNGTWQDWRIHLDSGNYTSYALASTTKYAGSSSTGGPATYVGLPRVTADSKSFPGQNKVEFKEYSNTSTNTPSSAWYHIISMQGSDTRYGTQLALGMTANAVYYRNYNNQAWIDWQPLGRFTATPTTGQVVITDGTTGGIKSSGSTIVATPSSKVNTNWGTASDRTTIVTKGWMSYWDGSYDGSASNLTYCNKGAFGTIITKNTGDYVLSHGNLNGTIGTDSPAADVKTFFMTSSVPTATSSIGYNTAGNEYTLIFGKGTNTAGYGAVLKFGYNSLYPLMLRVQNGTWKSTDWEKISAGYADRATYLDVVASNEIRLYNDNQFNRNNHFWIGYSWAQGSHYTPSGGTNTASTTAPNITKYVIGNCSGGGLAGIHAASLILGQGDAPTSSSATSTLKAAAGTTGTYLLPSIGNGTYTLSCGHEDLSAGSGSLTSANVLVPSYTKFIKIVFKSDSSTTLYSMVEIPYFGNGDYSALVQVGTYADGYQGSPRIVMKAIIINIKNGSETGKKTFTVTGSPTTKINGSNVSDVTRNISIFKIYASD